MDNSAMETPLAQLQSMLAADGYELSWQQLDGEEIELEVKAGAEACAECLVPKQVMQEIANQMLAGAGVRVASIVYPVEQAGHH